MQSSDSLSHGGPVLLGMSFTSRHRIPADLFERMTFVGSSMQGIAYYILSQLVVWEVDFPGGVDINNIKFRAVVWVVSEVLLIMVVALNYLPRELLCDIQAVVLISRT